MSLWLIATLLGGLFQAWRTAVQQRVRATLSVNGAGMVRYLYGFPVGCLLLFGYLQRGDLNLPAILPAFWLDATLAGLAQIIGTVLLILAFGHRNFVVGTAYAKTEAIQGAFLAMIILGETLSPLTWAGIAVGVVGVILLSIDSRDGGLRGLWRQMGQPAALCGLGAGFMFAITAIFVKRATFAIETQDKVLAALVTLVAVLFLQTLMQGGYLLWKERAQFRLIFRSWRVSGQVGLLAALGSACWFTAFALAPVALVRAVGQVEVIFTLLFARLYLREPMHKREVIGLVIVGIGVVITLTANIEVIGN